MPQAAKVHRAKDRGTVQRKRDRTPYDRRLWRDHVRPQQLAREPYCRECKAEGKVKLAKHVDHIDGDNTNNDEDNLQSLCHSHHSRKTVKHDGGFGNRKERK